MNKILLSLCIVLSLISCSSAHQSKEIKSSGRIRIFYNNDNISFLEPCGCRVSPIGGLIRRWNAMMAYPEDTRVFVDAGNLLFKANKAADFLRGQWYEQAHGMIEGYNILGTDAVTVGETEFALGVDTFLELAKGAKFPFISSNIYWKKSGDLLLKDSVMITRQGKKIGIFGVFNPALTLPEELTATDPVEASRTMVKKLRSQGAEMVIALSHQGYEQDEKMLQKVSGIDLLVGAHSQSLIQFPDMIKDTLVVQLSNQGQMLGLVEYDVNEFPKKRTEFTVTELNADYNEAPKGLANPMKNLIAVTNLKMAEANKKLEDKLWATHQNMKEGYQSFVSCKDCHSKQAQFHEGKLHSAAFLTLVSKNKEHNMDCVKCHSVGLGKDGGFTSLSNAFLNEEGAAIPYEKIRAAMGNVPEHDVNYRDNRAKIRPDVQKWIESLKKAGVKKAFVSVQCENCHGGMEGHPFDFSKKPAKVAANTCVQCHSKEQMPSWYDSKGELNQKTVAAAIKEMTCPKGK